MRVSACANCAELWAGGSACPRCGAPPVEGVEGLLAWERARSRERFARWSAEGAVDEGTARALLARLEREAPGAEPSAAAAEGDARPEGPRGASAGGPPGAGVAVERGDDAALERGDGVAAVERSADALASGAAAFAREVAARWARLARAVDEGQAPPDGAAAAGAPAGENAEGGATPAAGGDEGEGRDDPPREREAAEAARAMFGGGAVVGAGVEAFAALDDVAPGPARPFGALEIFWFIGTFLVLAGSVMGVREAWATLTGVWRPVVIAAAFFAYHSMFVGLARGLVRRSAVTGGVLATIAAGLVPVVFAAAAVAIGQRPSVGLPFAGALFAASAATLAFGGRVAGGPGSGVALALGLGPALALEIDVGAGGATPEHRVAVALAAFVPVGWAATRSRRAAGRAAIVGLAAAAYGALAVGVFALYGGPGDRVLDPDADPLARRALIAWLAAAATAGWWATSHGARPEPPGPRRAVARVVALAALAGAACAALVTGLESALGLGPAAFAPAAVLAAATAVFAAEQRSRAGALHPAAASALAAAFVAGRRLAPDRPDVWPAAGAVVAAAMLAGSVLAGDRGRRRALGAWGLVSGTLLSLATLSLEAAAAGRAPGAAAPAQAAPWAATFVTPPSVVGASVAALLALAAHAAGGSRRPWAHYPGAAFALAAILARAAPARPEPAIATWMTACAALAAVYGIAALAHERFAPAGDDRRPLDDASLLLAALGTWAGAFLAPAALAGAPTAAPGAPATTGGAGPGLWSVGAPSAAAAAPALALAAVLLLRAPRDRSALVTAHAAAALALGARLGAGAPSGGAAAVVDGAAALACAALAAPRAPRAEGGGRFGRALFGLIPLPLGAEGRTLLDGFAACSAGLAVATCARALAWAAGARPEAERPLVVLGVACAAAAAVLAFASPSFERWRARGSMAMLAAAGAAVGLAAVVNRVGRPLPPGVVGLRLAVVVAATWLAARAVVALGPRAGRALGRPDDGPRYHLVPHAGVAALTVVLLVDAWLVGAPTLGRALAVVPPLLLAGGALGALLLYRSFGGEPLAHAGLLALLGAAALAAAQGSVRGVELAPLDPPGGRWVPRATAAAAALDWTNPARLLGAPEAVPSLRARAVFGLATAGLALAAALAASTRSPALGRALCRGAFARPEAHAPAAVARALAVAVFVAIATAAAGLAAAPAVPAAAVALAAGALSAVAASPRRRAAALALAAPTFVHALAQRGAAVPGWAGPCLAGLALAAVVAGRLVSARRGRDPSALGKAQLVALAYAPLAVAYALAAGGGTSRDAAAGRVADLAAAAAAGAWRPSYAPAATLVTLAAAAAIAALAWRGALAGLLASTTPPAIVAAGAAAVAAFTSLTGPGALAALVAREGALLTLACAAAAAAGHAATLTAGRAGRDDAAAGFGAGRDAALVAASLASAAFVAAEEPGGAFVGFAGVAGPGLALAVCLHAAVRGGAGRHAALAEVLVVAAYAFAARALRLRPEVHALLGLLYGFSLVGVVIVARRRGAASLAGATRWVVAALPPALAWLTADGDASRADAALALGASALYATAARAERSRTFGSLASAAANLGLVALALAQGLGGVETYAGPLGLLIAALAQIYAPSLGRPARSALRALGGALLYVPAGLKLALGLGEAADGTYAAAFGAACLLGVAAGVALRVRAYLALGTLFLTLDVVANLVHAGLRDHRVGFVLLSTSGLAILAGMVGVTLRRDRLLAAVARARARLRTWD